MTRHLMLFPRLEVGDTIVFSNDLPQSGFNEEDVWTVTTITRDDHGKAIAITLSLTAGQG